MTVRVDERDHEVAAERNAALRLRIAAGKWYTAHRNLTAVGAVETDEEMGSRVQEEMDTLRAQHQRAAEVRLHYALSCRVRAF